MTVTAKADGQPNVVELDERLAFMATMRVLAKQIHSNAMLKRTLQQFSPEARQTVYDALRPLLIRKFTLLSFESLTRSM